MQALYILRLVSRGTTTAERALGLVWTVGEAGEHTCDTVTEFWVMTSGVMHGGGSGGSGKEAGGGGLRGHRHVHRQRITSLSSSHAATPLGAGLHLSAWLLGRSWLCLSCLVAAEPRRATITYAVSRLCLLLGCRRTAMGSGSSQGEMSPEDRGDGEQSLEDRGDGPADGLLASGLRTSGLLASGIFPSFLSDSTPLSPTASCVTRSSSRMLSSCIPSTSEASPSPWQSELRSNTGESAPPSRNEQGGDASGALQALRRGEFLGEFRGEAHLGDRRGEAHAEERREDCREDCRVPHCDSRRDLLGVKTINGLDLLTGLCNASALELAALRCRRNGYCLATPELGSGRYLGTRRFFGSASSSSSSSSSSPSPSCVSPSRSDSTLNACRICARSSSGSRMLCVVISNSPPAPGFIGCS